MKALGEEQILTINLQNLKKTVVWLWLCFWIYSQSHTTEQSLKINQY